MIPILVILFIVFLLIIFSIIKIWEELDELHHKYEDMEQQLTLVKNTLIKLNDKINGAQK